MFWFIYFRLNIDICIIVVSNNYVGYCNGGYYKFGFFLYKKLCMSIIVSVRGKLCLCLF